MVARVANINISVCKGSNVDTAFGGNKQLWYARVGSWCISPARFYFRRM